MEKIQKINRRKQEMESKLNMRAKQGISNTGITLVALVVTIIVLLILAGVSINLVAGSNGLLNKATKAVDVTNTAKIKEDIELKIAEMQMDYYSDSNLRNQYVNVNEYIKAELEKGVELPNGAEISCDTTGKLSYEGIEIGSLNSDGTVTIDGELSGSQIVTKYTVSYNANGGQGGPASKKYAAGESVTVDFTTKPTKKGANFLGWARSSTATTPEYTTSGSFIIDQNITLYAIWEKNAVGIIVPTNYGDSVNYSANNINGWKVFLNDGSNIYIIASDYAQINGVTIPTGITNGTYNVYGDSRTNLVDWLKTESNWNVYVNGISGATATGGPTLSQFVKSYNQKMGTSYSDDTEQSSAFISNITDVLYNSHVGDSWNGVYGYWLASVSANDYAWHMVAIDSKLYADGWNDVDIGIRPLVKLPADVKMSWNGTAWDLSE